MFSKPILTVFLLAIASTASAQSQSFRQVIADTPELSLFNSLLELGQDLSDEFNDLISFTPGGGASQKTVLVPNNQAIQQFLTSNNINEIRDVSRDVVRPFLAYHVLDGNTTSSDFSKPGGSIVQTKLRDDRWSLLPNNLGQVVYGRPKEGEESEQAKTLQIESGLKQTINILQEDLPYENGVVHVVDGLLTLPKTCSETIRHTGAERLVEYIKQVDLLDDLDSFVGATCFAPSDEVIDAARPVLQNMTDQQLIDAIQFHTLTEPFYTNNFTDGQQIPTLLGPSITVNVRDNKFYFNGIRAKTVNDIARNGVAYLLDGIMPTEFDGVIPEDTTTTTTTSPASTATTITTQTTAGAATNTTTQTPPSPTESEPSSAGALRVGSSILVAGFVALLAAF